MTIQMRTLVAWPAPVVLGWGRVRSSWLCAPLLLILCTSFATATAGAQEAARETPLLLISIDGFRWDYMERYAAESPTLQGLRREGATAQSLIPVFPSNTFPNHYTIVTGLYPMHHGIVDNAFFDPALGAAFRFNQPGAAADAKWWGGEPIWVTAIKQGRKAATAFWVGSETEIAGVRPTFWRRFDYSIPFEQRLEELVGWLKLPLAQRPALVAFYLEETNGAGHRYGPDSPEVAAAVKLSDERIARMLARLRAEQIEPNVVILSDHGMTSTSSDRVIILEDHIDRAAVQVDIDGSAAALRPLQGDADSLVRALGNLPHAKVFRGEDLPPHLHMGRNDRIAPVWVLPDEGWHFVTRSTHERLLRNYKAQGYLGGDHGYDPALPNMHGILIAQGPAFQAAARYGSVENVHVYNLLCAVLGLKPAKNDGDDRLVKAFLKK